MELIQQDRLLFKKTIDWMSFDQDWEYPADLDRGAKNDSREQFNILIKVNIQFNISINIVGSRKCDNRLKMMVNNFF